MAWYFAYTTSDYNSNQMWAECWIMIAIVLLGGGGGSYFEAVRTNINYPPSFWSKHVVLLKNDRLKDMTIDVVQGE